MNWTPVDVRLGDLKPWERNPKTISKAHAKRLLELWERLGQFQTIAIGPGGEVYDGHQRLNVLKAAHGVGYTVRALQAERTLTEAEREELTIAAHVGTTGQFDWDALSGWDAGNLQQWGFDAETLDGWRVDTAALDAMLVADDWDKATSGLPTEDKAPFQQMTFTLHNDQVEIVNRAMAAAKDMGPFVETENGNSNGNALARICEVFIGGNG